MKKFYRLVAGALSLVMGVQPAFAVTYQYNVFVKGFAPHTASIGNGVGSINPGLDPTPPVQAPPSAPQLYLSPGALTFNLLPGDAPQTLSTDLVNTGSAPAALGNAIVSNKDFTVSSTCPGTLAPGASCSISATFQQTGQGEVSYVMPLDVNGQQTPVALTLQAKVPSTSGARPQLKLESDIVDLGSLNPGETGTGTSTVVNVGAAAADLSGIAPSNGFNVSSNCPARLEPQSSCTVTGSYSSYAPGPAEATLQILGEAQGTPVPLTFKASVISNPALAPFLKFDAAQVDFGTVSAGSTVTKSTRLTNSGTVPATLLTPQTSPDFAITSNCGSVLAANDSCLFTISYTAKASSPQPAFELTVSSKEKVSTSVFIHASVTTGSGTGGTPTASIAFSPTDLAFGSVNIGKSSMKVAKLTNQASTAMTISGIAVEYDNYGAFNESNDCGAQLAPGASCNVSVTFSPTTTTVASSARVRAMAKNGDMTVTNLSGQGIGAIPTVAPGQLLLGAMTLNGGAVAKSVGLSNTGNTDLTDINISSPNSNVAINSGNCGSVLKPRENCLFSVTYNPTSLGNVSTSVNVNSSNASPAVVTLSGAVVSVDISPNALSFGDTRVGQTAPVQSVTLTNQGPTDIPLDGIAVSAGVTDYNQANNCGTSLRAGASCTINVAFTPTLEGTRTGTVAVVSLNTVIAQTSLTGIASAPGLTLTPNPVAFPATSTGTSQTMKMVVKNPTSGTVSISGMGIVDRPDVFSQSNNCGTELASGATCTVTLLAQPPADGNYSGSWALTSSLGDKTAQLSVSAGTPQATLTGDGSGLTPSAATGDGYTHYAIKFLDTQYGTSSAVRNVTLNNTGTGPLKVSGVSVVSGLSDFSQSNNCGLSIPVGGSCTIALLFTPSQGGARTGGVAVTTGNGKFYFDLSGNGIGPEGTWSGVSDFGMVAAGQIVQRTLTLKNTSTVDAANVVTTLQGQDVTLLSNNCGTAKSPISLAAGQTCNVSIQYAPTDVGTSVKGSLTATGTWLSNTVTVPVNGMSPTPGLAFDTTPAGDFGTTTVGATSTRTFYLRNVGKLSDSIATMPNVSGDGFSRIGGTCAPGLTLAANATCTVAVALSAPATGTQSGLLTAASASHAGAQLALSGAAIQSAYSISGTFGSNTTPSVDFGKMSVNSSVVVTKDYYLRDNTNIATVVANPITVSGAPGFTVKAVNVLDYNGSLVANCAFTSTGTTSVCSAGAPNRVIHVQVGFTNAASGTNSATLTFKDNGSNGTDQVSLTGQGVFDVNAVTAYMYRRIDSTWLPVNPNMGAVSFGSPDGSVGTSVTRKFYIQNSGTYGGLTVTPTITGDNDFKIIDIYKADKYESYTGACGSTIAPGGASATKCTADDASQMSYGAMNYIAVTVVFSPQAAGSRAATLSFAHNGINTPNPQTLSLTGSGVYNATAATYYNSFGNFYPISSVGFGSIAVGSASNFTVYVQNRASYGKLGVTPSITADGDFHIVQVYKTNHYAQYAGNCGAVINGTSDATTQCLGDDVSATFEGASPDTAVVVQFKPITKGTRTGQLVLSHTGLNTPNPIVVSLGGSGT